MPSSREMRLRIRSIHSISQVTRALQAVSASKVRKAMQATLATKPYAEKAWKVLIHLARQPGHTSLHPLLTTRAEIKKTLVVMISSDRGLSGSYNINVLRKTLENFAKPAAPVNFVAIGRKGRDMLIRRRLNVIAEFSDLNSPTAFTEVSPIGHLIVEDFLKGEADQVYLVYTDFHNLLRQEVIVRKILPLEVEFGSKDDHSFNVTHHQTQAVFTYEPDQDILLDEIIPRFTAMQVYQAILSAQASEHAARMIAMRNATDNAIDLMAALKLEYNKFRQQSITNEMLDITSGAEALGKSQF